MRSDGPIDIELHLQSSPAAQYVLMLPGAERISANDALRVRIQVPDVIEAYKLIRLLAQRILTGQSGAAQ